MKQTNIEKSQTNGEQAWAMLFLVLTIFLGGLVRLYPVFSSDFPLHDGGLFYAMIEDLVSNDFRLPVYTSYNQLEIPYVYPPLTFYLTGALSEVFNIPLIALIRLLPAIISTLCIPTFYFLARIILRRRSIAVLGTLAFAFMPTSFAWYILGGGITRSFAMLFYFLAAGFTYRLFSNPDFRKSEVLLAGLFNLLIVLSHPEGALQAAATGLFFFLFLGRSKQGLFKAGLVGLIVLLGSCLWLLPVLGRHGLQPFQSAMQLSEHSLTTLWLILVPDFSGEQNITLFTVFALIGVFYCLKKKQPFLILWLLVPILADTRSADGYSIAVLAILSAVGIDAIAVNLLDNGDESASWASRIEQNGIIKLMMAYLLFLGMVSAFGYTLQLQRIHITESQLEALEWINENTSPDAEFITLTGASDSFTDPLLEWFPVFSKRHNINTLQGLEWTMGADFEAYYDALDEVQGCYSRDITCLEDWLMENNRKVNYIVIQNKVSGSIKNSLGIGTLNDSNPKLVYQDGSILIYAIN